MADFETKVVRPDPAWGGAYFPNVIAPGRGPGGALNETPRPRWVEDYFRDATRFRLDLEFLEKRGQAFESSGHMVYLFDGKFSWVYEPAKGKARCTSGRTSAVAPGMDYYGDIVGYPGLMAKGSRSVGGDIGEAYDLADLDDTKYREAGAEQLGAESCVVIERPGLDKIWLSSGKGHVVVRREWRWSPGGPLKRRIDNEGFRLGPTGMWLPERGSMEVFSQAPPDGKPVGSLAYKLLEARDDPEDRFLKPDFPIGTLVEELDTGSHYLFGREQEQIDKAVARASQLGPAFRPRPWYRRPFPLAIASAGLLSLSWVCYLRFKRTG